MPFGRKRPEESGEPSVEREIVLRAFAFEKVTELNGAADVADVNTPAVEKPGKKRTSAGIVENTGNEVHSMLEKLGDFINNVILAKKKRLSIYTKASLKASSQKIEHIWKTQQDQRQKLNQEYSQQFLTLFHEWEMEMQKTEEQVEKLTNLFQQQHKLFQQSRVYQSQRLNAIKQLHEQFTKSMLELDKDQDTLLAGAQDELKKEMALLQKQIMMDTQQQEMASVRKSLQSILY